MLEDLPHPGDPCFSLGHATLGRQKGQGLAGPVDTSQIGASHLKEILQRRECIGGEGEPFGWTQDIEKERPGANGIYHLGRHFGGGRSEHPALVPPSPCCGQPKQSPPPSVRWI